jgi:hypothetical protein
MLKAQVVAISNTEPRMLLKTFSLRYSALMAN